MTEREPAYNLNLNTLTWPALHALYQHDEQQVGTEGYLGLAYFWAYAYRYPLRDVSNACRRRVHTAFLAAGLPVDEESADHERIISECLTRQDRERLDRCYGGNSYSTYADRALTSA